MFGKRWTLFELFGFKVQLDASWLVLALLVTWSLAKGAFPQYYPGLPSATYWSMGILGMIGLVFSIVFHEASHSLVARAHGMQIKGITLFIFGGVAELGEEPETARTEFLVAIAGPRTPVQTGINPQDLDIVLPSCLSGALEAQPGIRLGEILDATLGHFFSICNVNYDLAWQPLIDQVSGGGCRPGYLCTPESEGAICEPE